MKIRVLSGCQMDGINSALQIIFPTDDVAGFHTYRLLGQEGDAIKKDLSTADIIFTIPLGPNFEELASDRVIRLGPKIQFVPQLAFSAFHPDIIYLERQDGTYVQTPMTDYNSIIAVSAFLLDFDLDQTLRLFNSFTYQALGYFDLIEASRKNILNDFAGYGIDIREPFTRWLGKPEPFMHSINHPKGFVLADIAVAASRTAGIWLDADQPLFENFPDYLATWVIYPVFKELAVRLGKVGNYRFKMIGTDNALTISLEVFLERSFEQYSKEDTRLWKLSTRIVETKAIIANLARSYSSC